MIIYIILIPLLFTNNINSSFMNNILDYTVRPIQSYFNNPKKNKEVIIKNYTLDPKLSGYFNLNLESLSGNISIKAWNQNQVSIEATKSGNEEELKNTIILVKLDKNNLKISTDNSDKNKSLSRIDYFIMVPEKTNLKISSINGNVTTKFINGKLDIHINKGNAKLNDCVNSVKAKVINGEIKLKQKRFGSKDSIFLETVSGNISIFLPKNIEGLLRAKTVSGKITSLMPINLDSITKQLNDSTWDYLKKNVVGHFSSGNSESPITLESVSGSINIKEY